VTTPIEVEQLVTDDPFKLSQLQYAMQKAAAHVEILRFIHGVIVDDVTTKNPNAAQRAVILEILRQMVTKQMYKEMDAVLNSMGYERRAP
jgi:hypothetical protein